MMAVGGGNRGVCKFFLEGHCKYGDRCRYSHPRQQKQSAQGGRNVCKYFLDGKCKYGDRCRYDHPTTGLGRGGQWNNQRDYNSRHQQAPPIHAGRNWNQSREPRGRLYSHEGMDDGGGNDQVDGWGHGGGRGDQWDHRGRGGGRRGHFQQQQQQTNDHYRYSSPDYNRRGGSYGRRGQDSSRGGFRGERKELFQQSHSGAPSQLTEPADIAAQIRNDMVETGEHMWPFSCYAYTKEVPCVPDMEDLSPEELRLLAYTAQASGTSAAFLQNVQELKSKRESVRRLYANITTEEVKKLLSMSGVSMIPVSGSDSTALFGPVSTGSGSGDGVPKLFTNIDPGTFLPPPTVPESKSIFPPPAADQAGGILPSATTAGPTTTADPNTTDGTSELTQEELEAFRAPEFTLWKIPENPPPSDLC